MAIQKIQFIGYVVYVGGKQAERSLQQFYPGMADIDNDIAGRIALMRGAIEQASRHGRIDGGSTTLKIFVAPEFFFRGPTGAYTYDQYQTALAALQEYAHQAKFADWLFVFGSVVVASDLDDDKKEVQNIVIVQRGNTGESGCHVIIKEHKSGKDFLVNPLGDDALDDRNVEHAAPAKVSDTGREKQKYNFGGEGIFSIDDITYGVEICYDHNMQRLRRSSVARGEARVQVQIIPSAGASIEAKGVVALAGGPVFNCDGLFGTGAGAHPDGISGHSQLCTVTTAAFAKTAAVLANVDILEHVAVAPGDLADGLFFKGAGQLHFYPATALPAASTRSKWKFWKDYEV